MFCEYYESFVSYDLVSIYVFLFLGDGNQDQMASVKKRKTNDQ
jgi:hypothetical protein